MNTHPPYTVQTVLVVLATASEAAGLRESAPELVSVHCERICQIALWSTMWKDLWKDKLYLVEIWTDITSNFSYVEDFVTVYNIWLPSYKNKIVQHYRKKT